MKKLPLNLSLLEGEASPFDEELERFAEGVFKMVFKMALDLPAKNRSRAFAAAAQSVGYLVGCVVSHRGGLQMVSDLGSEMRKAFISSMELTEEFKQGVLKKTLEELNEELAAAQH
jgi:hypothetical protein